MTTRVLFDADRERTNPRRCGECTLCCKLLPIPELGKPAGKPCDHQRFRHGCTIYPHRPSACRYWSCRWLMNEDTRDLRRPDRAHYVIDIMPDYVTLTDGASGQKSNIEVVQIWIDPDYPDAHRDPALRAYLLRRAEEGIAALVRYDNTRALHIFAPPLAQDGQWHEGEGDTLRRQHTQDEIDDALKQRHITRVES